MTPGKERDSVGGSVGSGGGGVRVGNDSIGHVGDHV